jgi:hypothetical protein
VLGDVVGVVAPAAEPDGDAEREEIDVSRLPI